MFNYFTKDMSFKIQAQRNVERIAGFRIADVKAKAMLWLRQHRNWQTEIIKPLLSIAD